MESHTPKVLMSYSHGSAGLLRKYIREQEDKRLAHLKLSEAQSAFSRLTAQTKPL